LPEGPGAYGVCPVCLWEDDGAPPWAVDGPNGISLVEGQQRYLATGAAHPADRRRARAPRPDEARGMGWQPLELTEELLARVAEAHAELEEELARDTIAAEQADDVFPAYNTAVADLRQEAQKLPYREVKERLRALSARQGLMFPEPEPEPELELMAHLLKNKRWRLQHPLEAAGWVWRHRHSASLSTRLRQLCSGTVRFAG
jgi:hypothetical protein